MFINKINTHVCLFDVILIVVKWILVQVLGINFAGTSFVYGTYRYVVRFSVSHFYDASAPKIIAMFVYKCSTFWHSEV